MDNMFGLNAWELWLIIAVALSIIEIITPGFVMICFGLGALGAMVPAALSLGWGWQLATFSIVSLLTLWLLRPFLSRIGKSKDIPTGVDALIGRQVRLRTDILAGTDFTEISIDGDVWRARVEDDAEVKSGTLVEIVGKDSLLLFIRPVVG